MSAFLAVFRFRADASFYVVVSAGVRGRATVAPRASHEVGLAAARIRVGVVTGIT
ncbi:MAG: hypothetical protein U0638_13805 [Phycisphaerales bacterium]